MGLQDLHNEVGGIVRKLSLGLIDIGVAKGDKVSKCFFPTHVLKSTFSTPRPLSAGATGGAYQTKLAGGSASTCSRNSNAKVVVVEDSDQFAKVREIRDRVPKLEHVILIEGDADDVISSQELIDRGAGRQASEWEQRWRSVTQATSARSSTPRAPPGPPRAA